jgi:hypothetical protein
MISHSLNILRLHGSLSYSVTLGFSEGKSLAEGKVPCSHIVSVLGQILPLPGPYVYHFQLHSADGRT